ncbi:membrane-spanning 4-domains subfamily A member 5-like isoform X1 [Erinaceus europaeus]|uniref:Membrane-spanning 4-domains subfamily A member 5-like isoform X1 n=1 Tax=Erinaceus europaeus TaxID=9365 RepID=A0ABM3W6Q0_ERIEU|nr:membrane-spanning 4-domains subfamily A member 5-like isoform X1 [Erinaceus europaeus]XP_060032254.1 membrane-spanning 4-domains subfamily A member 5-like isoform X1 [Erinaceus europaeus]
MPGYYLHIKKETRMLGAIQIMNGLFLSSLGQLWIYLFVTQMYAIGKNYPHIVISTGYPFWSSMLFILSGIFTVLLEKWRLKVLVPAEVQPFLPMEEPSSPQWRGDAERQMKICISFRRLLRKNAF